MGVADPGRCSSTLARGRSGRGWAADCWLDEPAFAAAIAELEPAFVAEAGFSLRDVLADGEPVSGSSRVQPVLLGMQLALTALWRSYGVEPDAVVGHSMGEVTAAVVAGALTVAEGLRVIATRSRLMSQLSGKGAVALVELDSESTQGLIADHPQVTVTVYASPRQTVIAGPAEAIDTLVAAARQQNTFARRVNMEVPFPPSDDGSHPAGAAGGTGRIWPRRPQPSRSSPRLSNIPVQQQFSMPTTGWPTCATRCAFSQAIAAAGAHHTRLRRDQPAPSAHQGQSPTPCGSAHHHSLGTLQRDTHDTLTFHTNLNAAHTIRPPPPITRPNRTPPFRPPPGTTLATGSDTARDGVRGAPSRPVHGAHRPVTR